MKQLLLSLALLSLIFPFLSCNTQVHKEEKNVQLAESNNIEVYYFHFTRRCATCNAVENETQTALKKIYPEQYNNGEIIFISINLEDEANKAIAEKLTVSGQALLVVHGKEKYDLTDDGFKYARSNPEKLHESIRATIDKLI